MKRKERRSAIKFYPKIFEIWVLGGLLFEVVQRGVHPPIPGQTFEFLWEQGPAGGGTPNQVAKFLRKRACSVPLLRSGSRFGPVKKHGLIGGQLKKKTP
jgi:hypothetical protein